LLRIESDRKLTGQDWKKQCDATKPILNTSNIPTSIPLAGKSNPLTCSSMKPAIKLEKARSAREVVEAFF
jgi:hypothetical protein